MRRQRLFLCGILIPVATLPHEPLENHGRMLFLVSLLCFLASAISLDWLFGDSPGVAISGDSGSGKTNTIEVLLTALARAAIPFIYIDPTGNSARRLEPVIADLPERLRRNFLTIRPSDITRIVSINPLHVDREGCTPIEWNARVTTKVAHVVRILLAAWGEYSLVGKTRLFTWLYRILKTLASCALTIPDCRHLLDVKGDFFLSLARAVRDPLARRAFEDLAARRSIDVDEQIESTRSRLLGFACESQVIEATLGRSDDDVLRMRQVILEGKSLIISLELGKVLRDEDQSILANIFLTDFLFEVMNMPAHQKRLYVVCLDELPIFANNGSGPLLMRAVREVRQHLVRFIWGFQGKDAFDDERFFRLALSQMGTLIAMRHKGLEDAKALGGHLGLSSYSPTKVKHRTVQEIQYNRGYDFPKLLDESENWSLAEQDGSSQAVGASEEETQTNTATSTDSENRTTHPDQFTPINDAVARARAKALGTAHARSTGTKTTTTTNKSTTKTRGGSRTWKMVPLARLVSELVETGVQYLSIDEQFMVPAARLARLPRGHALVYVSGDGVRYVRFPLLPDPFRLTPKFGKKKTGELLAMQRALPYYRSPEAILEQRQALLQETIRELDRLADDPSLLPGTTAGMGSPAPRAQTDIPNLDDPGSVLGI